MKPNTHILGFLRKDKKPCPKQDPKEMVNFLVESLSQAKRWSEEERFKNKMVFCECLQEIKE